MDAYETRYKTLVEKKLFEGVQEFKDRMITNPESTFEGHYLMVGMVKGLMAGLDILKEVEVELTRRPEDKRKPWTITSRYED